MPLPGRPINSAASRGDSRYDCDPALYLAAVYCSNWRSPEFTGMKSLP